MSDPYLPEGARPPKSRAAFRTFLLKVHSRCNLACDYCYIYEMGDTGWSKKPPRMSNEVVQCTAQRIREHALLHQLTTVDVVFHGGEPLLVGAQKLAQHTETIRRELEGLEVRFGLQTNGVLLDTNAATIFRSSGIQVGISLDGPADINDKHRPDHRGRGSWAAVMEGVEHAREAGILSGFLAVIDVESDPAELIQFFYEIGARNLDLLLPHGHHDRLPPGKTGFEDLRYGRWLIRAYDAWIASYSRMRLRIFADLLKLALGGRSVVESLGLAPKSLVVVESDGSIEPVDTLRSVYNGATEVGLHIERDSFDDALRHPAFWSRYIGSEALSLDCRGCDHVELCGGGYLPHRWSAANGYLNVSVYCRDLTLLCEHVLRSLRAESSA